MSLKPVVDWLVYLVVRVLLCAIQATSLEGCYAFARLLGEFAYRVDRRHRKVAFDNLLHAFPGKYSPAELEALVRKVFVHFASMIVEMAHLPRLMHHTTWKNYFRKCKHAAGIKLILMSDRPVILMTAHFGNWEIAGYAFAAAGFKLHSVARALDNPYLERLIRQFRTRTGQEIIYKRGAFDQVSALMQRGALVGFLSDQDAGHRGVFVEFFGRPASSHKGVAVLSLQHDAPILVGFARRIGRGLQYEVWIEKMLDPRDFRHLPDPVWSITQECARGIEAAARQNPEQYFWLHRRWKHRPQREEEPKAA